MKNILVAYDGSRPSIKALKHALEIALVFKSSLTVLGVVPEVYITVLGDAERRQIEKALQDETAASLERARASISGHPIDSKAISRQGDAVEVIIETVKKMHIDLLVVGAQGKHGSRKFLLGSVAGRLAEHSPCPVLVIR